jgi:sigma54-dependent transcription regulator
VRFVAATSRDLSTEVDAGRFRRDLWARLSLWELPVPPLAERRAEVPGWTVLVHGRWCAERGRAAAPLRFDAEAVKARSSRPFLPTTCVGWIAWCTVSPSRPKRAPSRPSGCARCWIARA